MKRRYTHSNRRTYGLVTLINVSVIGMFVAVLWPTPSVQPVVYDAAITKKITRNIPITAKAIIGTAERISVPSVGIDASVRPGSYNVDARTWSIDTTAAFHANTTVPVNNTNGSTLIYGHAGWGIFGALPDVKDGAEAYVDTAEGDRFSYTFESSRQVDPADVSALTATGPPKLILQTCSGAFDAYRTLVTFQLKSVTKNE